MKKILFCLAIACGSSPLFAAHSHPAGSIGSHERHIEIFQRLLDSNNLVTPPPLARWEGAEYPIIIPRKVGGRLTTTTSPYMESLLPYDKEGGDLFARPAIIDDLYYETLLIQDPVAKSDRYYPLVAQAIRYPDSMSYVVFEIDQNARFQDGSRITPTDVLFSIGVRMKSCWKTFQQYNEIVSAVSLTEKEIKFDLIPSGQGARDAIAFLSQTKIIKTRTETENSDVRFPYLGSGPYRVANYSKTRLILDLNPEYWGRDIHARNGFFNFSRVEVLAVRDQAGERALANGTIANFYQEKNLLRPPLSAAPLIAKRGMIVRNQINRTTGKPLRTLQFNLAQVHTMEPLVREALTLAYDFDAINSAQYASRLKRPRSLLEESTFAPNGTASSFVKEITSLCDLETPSPGGVVFESYGNSIYNSMLNHQSRLLAAQARLVEAGYKVIEGRQMIEERAGDFIPLNLTLLIQDASDRPAMEHYRKDLASIGIQLTIVQAANEDDFRAKLLKTPFSMYTNNITLLNADGWPDVQQIRSLSTYSKPSPCLKRMLDILRPLNPRNEAYRALAEGIARAHQSIAANIFLGEAQTVEFAVDSTIDVPPGLPLEGMHMYGFSIPAQMRPGPISF